MFFADAVMLAATAGISWIYAGFQHVGTGYIG